MRLGDKQEKETRPETVTGGGRDDAMHNSKAGQARPHVFVVAELHQLDFTQDTLPVHDVVERAGHLPTPCSTSDCGDTVERQWRRHAPFV